jgi:hypothetical protein
MGNTTIIELNHDQWAEIFQDDGSQQEFLRQIREQLACMSYNGKDIVGGKVIAGFHRSGKIYDLWMKFKERASKQT